MDPWREGSWLCGDGGVVPVPSPSLAPSADPIGDAYWDALRQIGGLFRLDDAQYVFQGWDEKAEALQVRTLLLA